MLPKVTMTLLPVDMYTINASKHSRIVWAVMMEWTDEENRVAVIALHKCRIKRTHIFVLLKLLNIKRVFVCRTVKFFLDTGGVSDHKGSS